MKLSDLRSPKGTRKRKKRVGRGRGSGHGKTSCRGSKGQKSRTGGGKRPGFEGGQMPLVRRLPKRGFINEFKKVYQIVNLSGLNRFEHGAQVDRDSLVNMRLIKNNGLIKILGKGELTVRNLTVSAEAFSETAKAAIEKLGGKAMKK